jgi:hypothetical protein
MIGSGFWGRTAEEGRSVDSDLPIYNNGTSTLRNKIKEDWVFGYYGLQ